MRLLFALLLLVATATAPVLAQPATPDPTPTPAPTPDNSTATAATDGGGGGGVVPTIFQKGVIGWIGSATNAEKTASAIQKAAYAVVLAIAYVPVPNNRENGYMNPTNGIWADVWDTRASVVMPLFWFFAAALFLAYSAASRFGILSEEARSGWFRRWARAVVLGYLSATLAGIWLDFRRGMTVLLLQDMTVSGIEAQVGAGIVLLAVVLLILTDLWAAVTLMLILGTVFIAITGAYPWLPLLFLGMATPFRVGRLASTLLLNTWFILTGLTLPIAAVVGFGFSLDISVQITQATTALGDEQFIAAAAEGAQVLLVTAAKFGSIFVGLLLAHKLIGLVDVLTPGIRLTPDKVSVREAAHNARDRASMAGDRARRPVVAARDAPRHVREGADSARETGKSVSSRISQMRQSINRESGDAEPTKAQTDRREYLRTMSSRVNDRSDDK